MATTQPHAAPRREDHPWHVSVQPVAAGGADDGGAIAALRALDAVGAIVLAVHVDTLPSLAEIVGRRGYVGWTIMVPGSVERRTIEAIVAAAGTGYCTDIAPGHPLPPVDEPAAAAMPSARLIGHATMPPPPIGTAATPNAAA